MLFYASTYPDLNEAANDKVVVLPLGAIEQHGPHLSVSTDTDIVTYVAQQIEKALPESVLLCPTLPFGSSHHHLSLGGTMSISPELYTQVVMDLVGSLVESGFKKIILLNGHGGNIVPAQQATFELRQKYRKTAGQLLLSTTYWTSGATPNEDIPGLKQQQMGHACEWETSMILRIAPHLVKDHTKVAAVDWGNPFDPASRGWITKDRTEPGHIGYPEFATSEKGETLFRVFTEDVVTFLNRIIAWDGKTWDA